jgi:hypothetical protein
VDKADLVDTERDMTVMVVLVKESDLEDMDMEQDTAKSVNIFLYTNYWFSLLIYGI